MHTSLRSASAMGGAKWLVAVGGMLCLCGCWAPPSAVLRREYPPGPVATLQGVTDVGYARIEALDCDTRKITLRALELAGTYAIGPQVRHWQSLRPGDAVDARISFQLSIYIPGSAGDGHPPAAKVQAVEPSYRLITLQYPSGATDLFKVQLHERLDGVVPGAWVDIFPLGVTSVRALGEHRSADQGACPPGGTRSSP